MLRLGDGGTRRVRTLDAAHTLEQAPPVLSCEVTGERCALVMTRAERGTWDVVTNHGVTRVPTWRFFAPELTTPLTVVAVSPADLGTAADPLPPEGSSADGLLRGDWVDQRGETGLVVGVTSGACDVDMQAHVWQGPDAVVVGGTSTLPGDTCPASALVTPATITLDAPLAGRPVVDVVTGRFLSYPRP